MKYGEALKAYYGKLGKKVEFPKKGSAEHAEIRKLMASGDIAPGSGVSAKAAEATGMVKTKRVRKAKAAPPPTAAQTLAASAPAKPEGTTLIDQPHITKKAISEVEDNAAKPPPKKRKPRAVQSDGLSPQQNQLEKLTVENSAMMVAPAAYPDLKQQLEKVLDKAPEGVPAKKERRPRADKTVEGRKSDDAPALAGERAPFSFAAIRTLLRQ
jgi:hypothetical protein